MRVLAGTAMVAALVAGCGSNNNMGTNDLGAPDLTTVMDLATPPMVLTGTNLAPGAGFFAVGVTSDDLAIYGDAKGALYAVSLAGGPPTKIDTGSGLQRIRGNVVFSWSSYDQMANLGALTVYTKAGGAVPLADSSIGRSSAASADGQYIAWTGNVDPTGTTVSVFVGKPDGTVKTEVLKNRSADQACLPTMAWWKDTFVVASCGDAGDAGVAPATIDLIDPQSFAVTELQNGATPFFSLDEAGSKLFTIDMGGSGILKTRGQSTSTVIDAGVADGFITHDGSAVVYVTTGGALKRWTATGTTTLVAANVSGFTGLSDSQAFLTYFGQFDQNSGLNDVFLASSTMANQTATALVADTTGAVYGDPFTSDEKFALYYANVDANTFAGTLAAFGTGAGGKSRDVAQNVWISAAAGSSRVVYNDNFMSTMMSGYADLKVVDLSGTAAPMVIATRADLDFFLTKARDRVLFTVNQAKGKEGVYVAPLP